jgi:hypothetical protein
MDGQRLFMVTIPMKTIRLGAGGGKDARAVGHFFSRHVSGLRDSKM